MTIAEREIERRAANRERLATRLMWWGNRRRLNRADADELGEWLDSAFLERMPFGMARLMEEPYMLSAVVALMRARNRSVSMQQWAEFDAKRAG